MPPSALTVSRHDDLAARAVLPLWTAAIFVSAVLVFSVQPMFAKMALPLLGGSPAVWSTSLVFFQGMLLAGYLYAHCSATWLPPGRQAILHLAVVAAAIFALPIALDEDTAPPRDSHPIIWLLGTLFAAVGLPFLALSANAPLLQAWFARTGHTGARDPYFLYAASNLGSALALLGYPFVAERLFDVQAQSWLWTGGFLLLMVLIALCAIVVQRAGPAADAGIDRAARAASAPVAWRKRAHWVLLAAVPSSLLVGVTAHLSIDIGALPLLWVVPLALYLLTFVLVFARRPKLKHAWIVWLQPACAIALLSFFWLREAMWVTMPLHLVAFFVTAMMCHGELARLRPPAARATEFYLLMSLGGVLGGAFSALAAPLLFSSVLEYPLAIVLACWLLPAAGPGNSWRARAGDIVLPGLLLLAVTSGVLRLPPESWRPALAFAFLVVLALVVYSFRPRPLRFALGAAAMLAFTPGEPGSTLLMQARSFFGVYRISLSDDGSRHILTHGTTVHGEQYTNPARRRTPLAYYTEAGPFGQALAARGAMQRRERIGIVGLGAGATACHARPGESWTFYEIDPLVRRVAQATPYFTYLADCAPDARIEIGDARLTLRQAPAGHYDLLALDAFSSDAIPVHLLTREAMALYFARLRDDGMLLIHVSNRHFDLKRILARIASSMDLAARAQFHVPDAAGGKPSEWVALARREADLGALAGDPRWVRLAADASAPLWTDSFSNILDALR